jgi:ATP-dependent helicase HrpB
VLPIEPVLPALRAALAAHRAVVLEAPPGAGKTTMVPLALLDEAWLGRQRIVMLEPRRLAARAAAARMAATLRESPGDTIGYRMRLDTRVGPRTRIEVVTEGILTRMLQHDLSLAGIGLVIFDEFHERSLAADTGLALTLAAAESLRDDLRILVMSATLDGDAVAQLLGGAPVIRSVGRAWPVTTTHSAPASGVASSRPHDIARHVASVVRRALEQEPGSVLVFLPGAGEIRRVEELLSGTLPPATSVYPLHGSLPAGMQDAAIAAAAPGTRKVVLATSIAETSLTIEGVRMVVDSGWMRVPRFSPRTGMTRLDTMRVSRASADQRRGRAGRTEPGVCLRCWSSGEDAGLVPFTRPEISDADLAPLALDLAASGFADPGELRWLDPPPAAAFAQARQLLRWLGALDHRQRLTVSGNAMAELGAHPRLAHMLLVAREAGSEALALAANLVALLEERDLLRGDGDLPGSDLQLRVDALVRRDRPADPALADRVRRSAVEWRRRAGRTAHAGDAMSVGALLALAYPDRVAQRRDVPGRFLLRNGRGASLPVHDPMAHAPWIVAAELDDAGSDARITLAAAVDFDDLMDAVSGQVESVDTIEWHSATRSVHARRQRRLGALVLSDAALIDADADEVVRQLIIGVREIGVGTLPWGAVAAALRQRIAFVHHHDRSWPDVGDAALEQSLESWLAPQLTGVRKWDQLEGIDFAAPIRAQLTWEQRQELDRLAPERIEVPSGSQIAVDYSDPGSPTLSVRLQEVFGWADSPRLLRQQVPVTMELLSPGRRPVQVTRDLASFWRAGYFDVRRDLRGRYPRHYWPEDPLVAEAVRGVKRTR